MRIINLLLLLFLFANCSQNNKIKVADKGKSRIEIQDRQGNQVVLDSIPERVVCLFDPSIDVIYMLGAQDKLVGINAETYFDKELYDYYKHIDPRIANQDLATPGSNEMVNIEGVIALKPELLITQNLSSNVISTLNNMGIAVYLASAESYDDLVQEMKDLSVLLGKEERGEHLVQYAQAKAEDLKRRSNTEANGHKKKVYFTWANGRIFSTAGRKSMMNDCLVLAGVENACPTDIDKPNINPETLITWNPDMIVMWNDSPDLFYNKKELASIKAIQDKQIFNLMPMFYYNPHTFKALSAAAAINGWAYPDNNVNVTDEVKDIIMNLYGEQMGTELLKYYL